MLTIPFTQLTCYGVDTLWLAAYTASIETCWVKIAGMFTSIDLAGTCPKLDRSRQVHGAVSVQLKVKIMRQQAAREQKLRRKNLTKYIPNAAAAVFKVLQSMAQAPAVGSKRRRLQAEEDILEPVTRGETVEATLAQRLTEYVERIDTDMVSTLPAEASTVRFCVGGWPWPA